MISVLLLSLAGPLATLDRIRGPYGPVAGKSCGKSTAVLGTGDIGGPGSVATSIVNIWRIRDNRDNTYRGYIVKVGSGSLYFEPDVPVQFVKLDVGNASVLRDPRYTIVGCFTHDLKLDRSFGQTDG